MKDIPIFIINKDRFHSLRDQVTELHRRNYTNITIIDNKSTYEPLLDWYRSSGLDVYYNKTARTCNGSLHWLANEYKIEKFLKPITESDFILNDSDVVPINECPFDFIDHMVEIRKEFNAQKIGLGLKIDDIPDFFYNKKKVIEIEAEFWNVNVKSKNFPDVTLYQAHIDTTFAVCRAGSYPAWGSGPDGPCFRLGNPYLARHMPWYYNYDNLPEDEKYYIKNLEPNKGPAWSWWAKDLIK